METKLGKIYKLAKFLQLKKVPILPKFLKAMIRILFSCDIPLEANIDNTVLFIHDGLGVVIHKRAKIGKNTKILQHVTIGGANGKKRLIDGVLTSVPVIGDDVLIGVGAMILGPVKIGNHAKIGAGAVVLNDVPDYGVAVGIPAKVIKIQTNNEKITNYNDYF